MTSLKIVVRYLDGRLVKGTTQNFNPAAPSFHITWEKDKSAADPLVVMLNTVKAVFFVKDFAGNRLYNERKEFVGNEPYQGRRMKIHFSDGEVMVGSSPNYAPGKPGFFFFPVDPGSNTIKAWIPTINVKNIEFV